MLFKHDSRNAALDGPLEPTSSLLPILELLNLLSISMPSFRPGARRNVSYNEETLRDRVPGALVLTTAAGAGGATSTHVP